MELTAKRLPFALELARTGRFQVKAVAEALGVARSNLGERLKCSVGRPRRTRADDEWLVPIIRAIVAERASYGYRRVTACPIRCE